MRDFREALLLTRDSLMFLPLIIFCFIPVRKKIILPLGRLIVKIIFVVSIVEIFSCMIFFLLPFHIANILNSLSYIFIFFWFYQREVDLKKSCLFFIFMTACLIGGFSYLACHIADIFLNPSNAYSTLLSIEIFYIQILFECFIILIVAYPTKKYLGWLVNHFHEELIWWKISIFPTIFTFVFYVFIPLDNSKMYIGRALELYIIASSVFLILAFIIYTMFYQIAYHIVEKERIRERTIYLEMEAEQSRKLQEYVELTSRLRHDFRFHLTALSGLMEKAAYEEAKSYIKKYSLDCSKPVKQYCKSSAINAVLNHYEHNCQEEHIKINISVHIKNEQELMDSDFCVILGNLLENAIYACRNQKIENRNIELKLGQTAAHVIVLSIRNPYIGSIQKEDTRFLSTKHSGEGQGLKSVSLIAEKYNGYMKVEYNENQFIVKVLLNV